MNGRPRLLFLCQTLPYPPDGGVWIRTYNVLRLLSSAFDVTALCFERARSAANGAPDGTSEPLDALRQLADVESFAIPQKRDPVRFAWDHLRSAALGRVYTTYLYESRDFRRRLTELLRTQTFDLVHVDSLVDLVGYLDLCADLPVACTHHAVESALLRSRAAVEARSWRSAYLRYQARLMAEVERDRCRRVALNVAVSEADGMELARLAPGSRVIVIPNGVDIDEFQPAPGDGSGVAYIGGLHWFPNRDALDFYCDEILPHLNATGSPVHARWIGQATAEDRRRYARDGVELTGHLKDVRPAMQGAACHIVPLRAGGGTRLKILNSWAMGKPVVSTSLGCEGLDAVDGDNILIRDDPRDFADAVRAVLADPALRRRLGDRARRTVEARYSWNIVGARLIVAYRELAHVGSRSVAAAS